jgi:hypothetical protein
VVRTDDSTRMDIPIRKIVVENDEFGTDLRPGPSFKFHPVTAADLKNHARMIRAVDRPARGHQAGIAARYRTKDARSRGLAAAVVGVDERGLAKTVLGSGYIPEKSYILDRFNSLQHTLRGILGNRENNRIRVRRKEIIDYVNS